MYLLTDIIPIKNWDSLSFSMKYTVEPLISVFFWEDTKTYANERFKLMGGFKNKGKEGNVLWKKNYNERSYCSDKNPNNFMKKY